MSKRWKLSRLDLYQYALIGVRDMIGYHSGNPFLTDGQEAEWDRVERELERRIKIVKTVKTIVSRATGEGDGE